MVSGATPVRGATLVDIPASLFVRTLPWWSVSRLIATAGAPKNALPTVTTTAAIQPGNCLAPAKLSLDMEHLIDVTSHPNRMAVSAEKRVTDDSEPL